MSDFDMLTNIAVITLIVSAAGLIHILKIYNNKPKIIKRIKLVTTLAVLLRVLYYFGTLILKIKPQLLTITNLLSLSAALIASIYVFS